MNLGDIVRKHRERKSLSISELAEQTAIPENIIIKIETDPNYSNTPHGRLQAKNLLKFLGTDELDFLEKTENETPYSDKISIKKLELTKYMTHLAILIILLVFVYANAIYNQKELEVTNKILDQSQLTQSKIIAEKPAQVRSITLKSTGDVWITAMIDGEKTIFNIKDGETKTINFQNKIAFETIGNVNQLIIQFGEQEVSFKDKEVIHNIFVDEEGIFYNGYNVLRGKPKI